METRKYIHLFRAEIRKSKNIENALDILIATITKDSTKELSKLTNTIDTQSNQIVMLTTQNENMRKIILPLVRPL